MKFPKQDLQDMVHGDQPEEYEVVQETNDGSSRWSTHHSQVFKFDGKFYETSYSKGATEYQDERPYEYEPDEIECMEVYPHEVTTVIYKITQ